MKLQFYRTEANWTRYTLYIREVLPLSYVQTPVEYSGTSVQKALAEWTVKWNWAVAHNIRFTLYCY
jgi:hypothetical protein